MFDHHSVAGIIRAVNVSCDRRFRLVVQRLFIRLNNLSTEAVLEGISNYDKVSNRSAQDRRKVNRIAGDSNAHRIKDILPDDIAVKCLPISGTYKHFPPTMWIKMFGLMILGRMCGQGGLHYIMMQLCIQQHVNLSQRMLMLLNDVEKNPGPEYSCKWISCKEDFHSIGQKDAHIISHMVQEKCCRWGDCTKVLSLNSLEIHALKHLYDVSLALCMN
ncbi:hypothetical protein DPMN_134811 [Dreissena polymorpha]|uniref:C2H2-type domain-containing protein n=1 Tax=Dreissena polymorpha TaxID=45954 RepID=A0A9D4FY00_DREPO|nr:hypothetical protein DPMN_134811 [Dreissena polymorpha]